MCHHANSRYWNCKSRGTTEQNKPPEWTWDCEEGGTSSLEQLWRASLVGPTASRRRMEVPVVETVVSHHKYFIFDQAGLEISYWRCFLFLFSISTPRRSYFRPSESLLGESKRSELQFQLHFRNGWAKLPKQEFPLAQRPRGAAGYEMLIKREENSLLSAAQASPLFPSFRNWRSASEWTAGSWSPSSSPSWWRWSSTCTCRNTRSCPTTDACCRPPSISAPSGGRPPGSPPDRFSFIHPPVSLLVTLVTVPQHLLISHVLPDTSQRGHNLPDFPSSSSSSSRHKLLKKRVPKLHECSLSCVVPFARCIFWTSLVDWESFEGDCNFLFTSLNFATIARLPTCRKTISSTVVSLKSALFVIQAEEPDGFSSFF